ncbi:MAG: cysteine--tRNA ligase, partial [Chlorobiales bacterium]|nr:cysteine--tRNA ligase [Chlorobiales bacterium]
GRHTSLKDLFKIFDPIVIRFFILQSHYRSPLDFSEVALSASQTGLDKLQDTYLRLIKTPPGTGILNFKSFIQLDTIDKALDDDFNTPVAISVIFEFIKAINSALDRPLGLSLKATGEAITFLETYAGEVLGILKSREELMANDTKHGSKTLGDVMNILLELRAEARKNKDFALSDKIRDKLLDAGIEIKDTKDGVSWSNKPGT